MKTEIKLDRRRSYYMVLDCETATLPYAANFTDGAQKQKIAIAKPLIYDLAYQIIDRKGNVYLKKSFLITEIFSVPSLFNTAYYASKRPIYLEKLRKGEIILTDWNTATAEFEKDLSLVKSVGAYNSMFDFKKAIPFTELYIKMLYSPNFFEWEKMQERICDDIATGNTRKPQKEFEPEIFRFRNKTYPLFDLWGLSCKYLLNNDNYKKTCINNNWTTASGKYFKTSAETAFRFCENIYDFNESHTALEDAIIESMLFAKIVKKKLSNLEIGIEYFPFRILGRADLYEQV